MSLTSVHPPLPIEKAERLIPMPAAQRDPMPLTGREFSSYLPGSSALGNPRPLGVSDEFPKQTDVSRLQPLSDSTLRPPLTNDQEEAALTKQFQRLFAQVFIAPVLKKMHEDPFKSGLFDGGRGAEAFQGMFDQHLIDKMASRVADKRLVKHMVQRAKAIRNYQANSSLAPVGAGAAAGAAGAIAPAAAPRGAN